MHGQIVIAIFCDRILLFSHRSLLSCRVCCILRPIVIIPASIIADKQDKFNLQNEFLEPKKINHNFRCKIKNLFINISWKFFNLPKDFPKACQNVHKKGENQAENVKHFNVSFFKRFHYGCFCMVFSADCLEKAGRMYDNKHNKREELYKLTGNLYGRKMEEVKYGKK